MSFPPNNPKEWIKLLKKLGFEERRVGKGKHAFKFSHPTRRTKDYRIQPDFIIIPHVIYPAISSHIVKEIMFFDFTLEEIKEAAR